MNPFNRAGKVALWAIFGCALASCGGGGGGGGSSGGGNNGGGSGNVTFTPSRTSLTFDYMEGFPPTSLDVVVTATGNFSGTLFLGASTTGLGISNNIPLVISSNTQGTFTVTAASGLAVGDYTGTLSLLACSDQACTRQIGNSPVNLPYTTRVHPRLRVSSNPVALTSHSDSGTSADVTITLPWQATSFTSNVEMGSDFLSVSQPTPTTLRLTARAWPSGQRTGVVRVDSGNQTEMIQVTYDVTPPAGGEFNLRSNPTSVTLSAIERTSAAPTTVTVLGPTWEPNMATETFVGYTAQSAGREWLQVDPVAGGYRLTASAAQLNAGTYTANLVVHATSSVIPSNQIEIPVSFTIGEGLAQPADREVTLDANTTAQSPVFNGSIPITLVDGPAVTWTAQSDSNWLTFSNGGTGNSGTSLNYTINPALLELTTSNVARDFVATVQITTNPVLTPRTFHVTVHQRLAHVRGIMPYYQVQGRPSRHVVRGDGFIANRDWSQHLYIMGAQPRPEQVTRVNDTELFVDLDAGQRVIDAHNELSAVPTWGVIPEIALTTNSYQVLPTGFEVGKLLYDARRRQLLVADRQADEQNNRFIAYLHDGTSWAQSPPTAMPGLRDMVIDNDYAAVWLITRSGIRGAALSGLHLSPADPDTTFAPLHHPSALPSMAFTNDWRIWFGSDNGSGVGNGVWYRDLLAASGINVPLESDLIQPYDGPWFTVSGNGERLYISQAATVSPAPPLLALDAKDGVVFEASQGDGTYLPSDAAINLDGSRLIGAGNVVRDLAYADIGSVEPNHQSYFAIAAAMNPAGTRAYVLAYDSNDMSNAPAQASPRVYVFDLTTPQSAGTRMPLLGYFTLADYPTCRTFAACLHPGIQLAPDGNTLFIAGSANLLVVPVPAEGSLTAANKIRVPATGIVTTPWKVDTRRH